MHRRVRRIVDRLEGTGSVSREGASLGEADYQITVYQEFTALPDGEELGGIPDWDVQLSGHSLDTFGLWQDSAMLILELEDGRQVQGFLDGNRFVLSGNVKDKGNE
jgi:hypothetical protein